MIKNCNAHFHRYVCTKEFMELLMQFLKRKRGKLNPLEKVAKVMKNEGWREVEDKILWMVQIWADTFMMQEEKYP